MTSEFILRTEGISKVFPGVQALDNVYLNSVGWGPCVTRRKWRWEKYLGQILNGVYSLDQGKIWINELLAKFHSPLDAMNKGISVIHQELSLAPRLNVDAISIWVDIR